MQVNDTVINKMDVSGSFRTLNYKIRDGEFEFTCMHSWNEYNYLIISKYYNNIDIRLTAHEGTKMFNAKPLLTEIVTTADKRNHKRLFNTIIKEELMATVWNPCKLRGEWLYLDAIIDA
jgi:hypothetical protein